MGGGCNSHTLLEEYVPQVSNVFETTKYLQFYSFYFRRPFSHSLILETSMGKWERPILVCIMSMNAFT